MQRKTSKAFLQTRKCPSLCFWMRVRGILNHQTKYNLNNTTLTFGLFRSPLIVYKSSFTSLPAQFNFCAFTTCDRNLSCLAQCRIFLHVVDSSREGPWKCNIICKVIEFILISTTICSEKDFVICWSLFILVNVFWLIEFRSRRIGIVPFRCKTVQIKW